MSTSKKELQKRGVHIPLVADIHFTPNAAEYAARIIEKVRVNPGNYADKKKFEEIDYTDSAYEKELERIYWKGVLWSPSYFAGSCGGAPLSVLKQYIEQQQRPT